MNNLVVPVILAGGQGTRLWPMSRTARPKQFLGLSGDLSLYQQTLTRFADPIRYLPPVVMTNAEYRFLVSEQAQEIGLAPASVLLEPSSRNTAAAIAAAACHISRTIGPDTIMHIAPSDHAVAMGDLYWSAVDLAIATAAQDLLVAFGIAPRTPETGYGYIEVGEPLDTGAFRIARFVEKPDLNTAQSMLSEGRYCWNSGMFMLRASTFIEECRQLAPDVLQAAEGAVIEAETDLDFIRLDLERFASAPDISVDYAIFEHTRAAAMVKSTFGWSDLGSWDSVWQSGAKDDAGNYVSGPATLNGTGRSLVVSERAHVAVDGLDDIAVIASEDAVYVGRLSESQRVGALVKALRSDEKTAELTRNHVTCYRPWGGYCSLAAGPRFQVKRIFVKPGKQLSLQKHHHRAEHWVVVRGTAEVTIGDRIMSISENESVYIPRGEVHRLANPGMIDLEIIEVQTGAYLGEDDIIRIEDEYGRA